MATTVTKVVDPNSGSGYDYASLSLWEAGQQGDLTGVRDEIAVAKCRCTSGTADTTAFTIDGWTTSATQYIKIWTDPSESYRHNGTYQTGNKYRIEGGSSLILIKEKVVKIIGIQFCLTTLSGHAYAIGIGTTGESGSETTIEQCILKSTSTGTTYSETGINTAQAGTDTHMVVVRNNIIYDFNGNTAYAAGINIDESGYYYYIYNNTIVDCYRGMNKSSSQGTVINNIVKGSGDTLAYVGYWYYFNSNATDGTDESDGSPGNRISQTFTFINEASDDFHLASNDAGALGYGLNLYNDANYPFQTDIDGQDRGGSGAQWDIGADEYVAAGGSSIVPLLLHQYRARRQ